MSTAITSRAEAATEPDAVKALGKVAGMETRQGWTERPVEIDRERRRHFGSRTKLVARVKRCTNVSIDSRRPLYFIDDDDDDDVNEVIETKRTGSVNLRTRSGFLIVCRAHGRAPLFEP